MGRRAALRRPQHDPEEARRRNNRNNQYSNDNDNDNDNDNTPSNKHTTTTTNNYNNDNDDSNNHNNNNYRRLGDDQGHEDPDAQGPADDEAHRVHAGPDHVRRGGPRLGRDELDALI